MPARKGARHVSPSASAPRRMTRSRAASQGVELPTSFHTPPDAVRRSRKASKSSKSSQEAIAEEEPAREEEEEEEKEKKKKELALLQTPVNIDQEEQSSEDGQDEAMSANVVPDHATTSQADHDVVSISSDSSSDEEQPQQTTQPQSKTDDVLSSDLGVPENESTPVARLEVASSPAAVRVTEPAPLPLPLPLPLPSQLPSSFCLPPPRPARKFLSPTTKRRQAINASPALPQPRPAARTKSKQPSGSMSPPPKPGNNKRRRANSAATSASASASEYDHEYDTDIDAKSRLVKYKPKQSEGDVSGSNKRPRRIKGNNAADHVAYNSEVQRTAERLRQEGHAALAGLQTASNAALNFVNAASQSATDNATRSAPNTPPHRSVSTILNPLLTSATKVFGYLGSFSAAPKLAIAINHGQASSSTAVQAASSETEPSNAQAVGVAHSHSTPNVVDSEDDAASMTSVVTPTRRPLLMKQPYRRTPARVRLFNRKLFKTRSEEPESRVEAAQSSRTGAESSSASADRSGAETQQNSRSRPHSEIEPADGERPNKIRKLNQAPHALRWQEEFVVEEWVNWRKVEADSTVGQKRKEGVGRTFRVPEYDTRSDTDSAAQKEATPAQASASTQASASAQNSAPAQDSAAVPDTSTQQAPPIPRVILPAVAPSGRVGRTYSVPEAPSSPDDSVVKDPPKAVVYGYEIKRVTDWTAQDEKEFLTIEHGFDPAGLIPEIPRLARGELPEMWDRARHALVLRRDRADRELDRRMDERYERQEQVLKNRAREYCSWLWDLTAEGHRLAVQNSEQYARNFAAMTGVDADWLVKACVKPKSNVQWIKNKENHVTSPGPNEPPLYTQQDATSNAFKSALKQNSNVVETASGSASDAAPAVAAPTQIAPPQPVSQPPTTASTSVVSEQAVATPAPIVPQQPDVPTPNPSHQLPVEIAAILPDKLPAPDTAAEPTDVNGEEATGLSARQLETIESQLSGINKYFPKQPSRLREVSRLSSSGLPQTPATPQANLETPASNYVGAVSPHDTSMHTVSDFESSPLVAPSARASPILDSAHASRVVDVGHQQAEPLPFGIRELPGSPSVRAAALQAVLNMSPTPFLAGHLVDESDNVPTPEKDRRWANVMAAIST